MDKYSYQENADGEFNVFIHGPKSQVQFMAHAEKEYYAELIVRALNEKLSTGQKDIKKKQRCMIVEVEGGEMANSGVSVPHIGKKGYATRNGARVEIVLDDGVIIYGHQCWWKSIEDDND